MIRTAYSLVRELRARCELFAEDRSDRVWIPVKRYPSDVSDDERLGETLAGMHVVVFAILMLVKAAPWLQVHNTL